MEHSKFGNKVEKNVNSLWNFSANMSQVEPTVCIDINSNDTNETVDKFDKNFVQVFASTNDCFGEKVQRSTKRSAQNTISNAVHKMKMMAKQDIKLDSQLASVDFSDNNEWIDKNDLAKDHELQFSKNVQTPNSNECNNKAKYSTGNAGDIDVAMGKETMLFESTPISTDIVSIVNVIVDDDGNTIGETVTFQSVETTADTVPEAAQSTKNANTSANHNRILDPVDLTGIPSDATSVVDLVGDDDFVTIEPSVRLESTTVSADAVPRNAHFTKNKGSFHKIAINIRELEPVHAHRRTTVISNSSIPVVDLIDDDDVVMIDDTVKSKSTTVSTLSTVPKTMHFSKNIPNTNTMFNNLHDVVSDYCEKIVHLSDDLDKDMEDETGLSKDCQIISSGGASYSTESIVEAMIGKPIQQLGPLTNDSDSIANFRDIRSAYSTYDGLIIQQTTLETPVLSPIENQAPSIGSSQLIPSADRRISHSMTNHQTNNNPYLVNCISSQKVRGNPLCTSTGMLKHTRARQLAPRPDERTSNTLSNHHIEPTSNINPVSVVCVTSQAGNQPESLSQNLNLVSGTAFKCSMCDKLFVSQSFCEKHILRDHGIAISLSSTCGTVVVSSGYQEASGDKILGNQLGITQVTTKVITKILTCDYCELTFSSSSKLDRHRALHLNEKVFDCPHCQNKFKRVDKLNDHIADVHTADRPFKCDHCEKTFTRNWKLNAHKSSNCWKLYVRK